MHTRISSINKDVDIEQLSVNSGDNGNLTPSVKGDFNDTSLVFGLKIFIVPAIDRGEWSCLTDFGDFLPINGDPWGILICKGSPTINCFNSNGNESFFGDERDNILGLLVSVFLVGVKFGVEVLRTVSLYSFFNNLFKERRGELADGDFGDDKFDDGDFFSFDLILKNQQLNNK